MSLKNKRKLLDGEIGREAVQDSAEVRLPLVTNTPKPTLKSNNRTSNRDWGITLLVYLMMLGGMASVYTAIGWNASFILWIVLVIPFSDEILTRFYGYKK